MPELGAVRLHGRGVARLHGDWISLGGGGSGEAKIMLTLLMYSP